MTCCIIQCNLSEHCTRVSAEAFHFNNVVVVESAWIADQPVGFPVSVVGCRPVHRNMREELLESRLLTSLVQILHNDAEIRTRKVTSFMRK